MKFKIDIIKYLDEHRITLATAARAAGMAPQNIRKCLMGNPKVENILAIANGLGIDPRDFFFDEDDLSISKKAMVKNDQISNNCENEKLQPVNTIAYCPHCGKKFKVGVVFV